MKENQDNGAPTITSTTTVSAQISHQLMAELKQN